MITGENFAHPTPPKCKNKHNSCNHWASIGECTKNPGYMVSNCGVACGTCCTSTSTASTTTTTKTTTTAPPAKCEDKSHHCPFWASIGQCQKNSAISLSCGKSCNTCCQDEDQALCSKIDLNNAIYYCNNPHVASLAQYPKKCKRTCGKCKGQCQDYYPLPWCLDQKERKRCNRFWTKSRCRNTCEKC